MAGSMFDPDGSCSPTFDDEGDTKRVSMPSMAEITLAAVFDLLDRVEPSPESRALRARADSYRRAIDNRASVAPSDLQRKALRELVSHLHDRVVESVERGLLAPRARC